MPRLERRGVKSEYGSRSKLEFFGFGRRTYMLLLTTFLHQRHNTAACIDLSLTPTGATVSVRAIQSGPSILYLNERVSERKARARFRLQSSMGESCLTSGHARTSPSLRWRSRLSQTQCLLWAVGCYRQRERLRRSFGKVGESCRSCIGMFQFSISCFILFLMRTYLIQPRRRYVDVPVRHGTHHLRKHRRADVY